MYIKRGGKWEIVSRVTGEDGKVRNELVEIENPETEPEEGSFLDGDKLTKETIDDVSASEAYDVVIEAQEALVAARKAVAEKGGSETAKALAEALAKFTLLNTELKARAALIDSASTDDEVPTIVTEPAVEESTAPESIAEPNVPVAPAQPATPATSPAPAPSSTPSDKGTKKDSGKSEGEAVDPTGTSETETGDPVELTEREKELVAIAASAAAAAVTGDNGVIQASGVRTQPRPVQKVSTFDRVTEDRKVAGFRSTFRSNYADSNETVDASQRAAMLKDFATTMGASRGNRTAMNPISNMFDLDVYDRDSAAVLDEKSQATLASMRATDSGRDAGHSHAIQADGSTCSSCSITPDVRREIPNQARSAESLDSLLKQYPADSCELEYYQNISIGGIDAGITVWDDARKQAFCTARDAWKASLRAGTPDTAQFNAMKAAEKDCAVPTCTGKDKIGQVAVAACYEYPIEMADCSPEVVTLHEEALMREYQRRKNMLRAEQMSQFMIPVDINGCDAPFTNDAGFARDGAEVFAEVIDELQTIGESAEYLADGNYAIMMDPRFIAKLDAGLRKSGASTTASIQDYVNLQIIPFYDSPSNLASQAAIEAAQSPTYPQNQSGDSQAFMDGQGGVPVGTGGVLPPSWKQGAVTPWDYNANHVVPNEFRAMLMVVDDFFEIRRPSIRIGTQVRVDDALGNMRFGLFAEDFFGIGKDGIYPAWDLRFSKLQYNGARVGTIDPVSCTP